MAQARIFQTKWGGKADLAPLLHRVFSGGGIPALQRSRAARAVFNVSLITLGCVIYLAGLQGILVPNRFLNGGMVGLVMLLDDFYPGLSFGLMYGLFNLPLFILGWFQVSHRFIYFTGFGILAFSVLSEVLSVPPVVINDPLAAACLAGVICGIGGGTILRSWGSAGGLDILAVFLKRKLSIPMGWTYFIVNAGILLAAARFYTLETAFYTAVFIFVQGKMIDAFVAGFNRRKSLWIVTDNASQVAESIMANLRRGVTYLEGSGAYTGTPKKVIFTVTTMTELARMKNLILEIDPEAFVVVNDTLDVIGSTVGMHRSL